MENHPESAPANWSVPQCPFTIDYSPRVLDDIRLAVMDAFCSMPRGGVEIGGVLLGTYGRGRLEIQDYVPLPIEHASGPSFELSAYDHMKLADALATARGNPQGGRPVGWYVSHTRSRIALTPPELGIFKRYFPEPWQVTLVLRPYEQQPTQAGFFFREADGAIRDASCYREFAMEPLAIGQLPVGAPVFQAAEAPEPAPLDRPAPVVPPVVPFEAREPKPSAPDSPVLPKAVPPFGQVTGQVQPKTSYKRQGIVLAVILVLAMAAWGYHTREFWLPARAPEVRYIGLNTADAGGQLQIRWDRNSPAVRQARAGALTIEDVGNPQVVELDAAHLQAGVFTYVRKGGKIDVGMTVDLADGQRVREATSFLGEAPPRPAAEDSAGAHKQVDELTKKLEDEQASNRKLEKSLLEARRQIQKQQRKRMGNQAR